MNRKFIRRTISAALFVLCAALTLAEPAPRFPTGNQLANPDFGSGRTSWDILNKSGDKVVCGASGHADDCAFRFKSSTHDDGSTLKQTFTPTGMTTTNDIILFGSVWVRSLKGSSCVKIKVLVKFNDGSDTLKSPYQACASGDSTWTENEIGSGESMTENTVKKVTLTLKHKGKGVLLVDQTSLAFDDK